MARSQLQIEEALIASIATNDPGADARKGPIRGVFVTPQAGQLNLAETIVDDLSLRYSLQYVRTRNPAIIDLYSFNHGLLRGDGSPSLTNLLFFAFQPPPAGSSIFIPGGSIVTSIDNTITFQTVGDVEVSSNDIELFFNSDARRYEIPVPAESLGIGSEFEISANRLRTLVTPVEYISGVTQPLPTSPSSDVESNTHLAQRQQAKLVGLAMGAPSGVESLIRDYDPQRVLDVATVYSTDMELFQRPTRRPAFDIYLIGTESTNNVDNFVAIGGETYFKPTKQPVNSVVTLTINGATVEGTLFQDPSPATRLSTNANDLVHLPTPAMGGDVITLVTAYDKLLNDVQEFILLANKRLWQADILLRQGYGIPIAVEMDITALSSYDTDRVQTLAEQAIYTSIQQNQFALTYYPDTTAQAVSAMVAGLSSINMRRFQRLDAQGVIPVDTIEMRRNEYGLLYGPDVTVTVRT